LSLKGKTRIAICTPTAGYVRIEWAESLSRLQLELHKDKRLDVQDSKLFYIAGSVIPYNRQWCVDEAIKWGASHVLFIDDDMSFTPNVVKRLLRSRDLPIVAANATKRVYPIKFICADQDTNGRYLIEEPSYDIWLGLAFEDRIDIAYHRRSDTHCRKDQYDEKNVYFKSRGHRDMKKYLFVFVSLFYRIIDELVYKASREYEYTQSDEE
jgi:hypothetical protein